MDFSTVNDIQINGKKLMIIFPQNATSGTQYLWRRHPEYPYLTFASCWKKTEIGDEVHVSGTHVYEGMDFCLGFTDKNKLLVPLDPDTSTNLNWPSLSNMYIEIYNSQTATTPSNTDILTHGIITGEYKNSLGSKVSHEYTFRAYGVKNEADHISFYNRLKELGASVVSSGRATYRDMQEWEVSDAEWTLSTEEAGKIEVYSQNNSGGNPINRYIQNISKRVSFNQGSLGYWPTSYYEKVNQTTGKIIAMGTPLITLDGKKGATKIVSVRDNFSDYKVHFPSSSPYIKAYMKIDCKSKSLGINETWGMYVGVTVKR